MSNVSLQRPSDLLILYNAVILQIEDTVTSHRLTDLSWPIPEFSRSNAVQGKIYHLSSIVDGNINIY